MNKFFVQLGIVVALLILAAYIFSSIFVYVVVSLIIATILGPITRSLDGIRILGFRVPRVLAIFLSFALMSAVLTLIVTLFIPLVSEQVSVITSVDPSKALDAIKKPVGNIETFLIKYNLTNNQPGFIIESSKKFLINYLDSIEVGGILNSLIVFTGNVFITLLAVVFITFFLLYDNGILKRILLKGVPNSYFELTLMMTYKIEKLLTNYLLGLLFQMISIFSIVSIGLSILGVKYALVIALFAAIANLIPYVGPILGASFGILVVLSTASIPLDFKPLLWVVLKISSVFGTAQLTDNLVLQPLIFSKSVKAHPLEIFIAIFAGGALAGLVGMIAAIPVYTILRVSGQEIFKAYKQYYIFNRFKKIN